MKKILLFPVFVVLITVLSLLPHDVHASTLLFQDNYANSGWTQVGSSVTVNSGFFSGVVHFNNAAGGQSVDDNRVLKKLPLTLPIGGWTTNFDYKFTASNIPAAYPFVLTTSSANAEMQGTGNSIIVFHGIGVDALEIRTFVGSAITDSASSIPISANTQYYVSLVRTPTQLVLSVFSDPARTMQIPSSPVSLDIASTDFGNLNFIQHSTKFTAGSSRTLTASIDNTRIFVQGQSGIQTLFQTNYQVPVWTQVGSSVTVNSLSFPGVAHFNNAAGGQTADDNRVLKKIPLTLPIGGWTANFNYKFTASNIPAAYPFVLTTSSANAEMQGTGNSIIVFHGIGVDALEIRTFVGPAITDSTSIPISVNTPYFVSLVRTPTQLVLSVFSDPARTMQIPGSPVSLDIASTDFGNLNFIQHSTKFTAGSSRTLTASIDNTRIFTP